MNRRQRRKKAVSPHAREDGFLLLFRGAQRIFPRNFFAKKAKNTTGTRASSTSSTTAMFTATPQAGQLKRLSVGGPEDLGPVYTIEF